MYYARKIVLRPMGGKTPTGGLPEPAPVHPDPTEDVSAGLVVVVYDSPTVRKMLAMHLQRHAFEVYTFTHGIEMMRWLTLSRRVPDLFLFDVRLPKINGYDLTRRIRKHPYFAASRVGLFTEEAERFDTLRGQLAGAHCRFPKPFTLSEVGQAVMKHVEWVHSRTKEGSDGRSNAKDHA